MLLKDQLIISRGIEVGDVATYFVALRMVEAPCPLIFWLVGRFDKG